MSSVAFIRRAQFGSSGSARMRRFAYITGTYEDQVEFQREIIKDSEFTISGGVMTNMEWIDFLSLLQSGDEVVVVAKSRISSDESELKAREEMLELMGVTLRSLT